MKPAYYNERDKNAAAWLRNLIAAGHIAPGDVDERDILDVRPDDLRGYIQCHFFAGIGVWSYALRLAGWPDDRPVWTGSCPCQPFSAAGAGLGFADERHLWPAWQWLIGERRPSIILGEQVASKDVEPWIDLVSTDLEGMGYAIGTTPFPSAGVGAPHIRDRTYFMAHADDARSQGRRRVRERAVKRPARASGLARVVADASGSRVPIGGHGATTAAPFRSCGQAWQQRLRADTGAGRTDAACELADADIGTSKQGRSIHGGRDSGGHAIARPGPCRDGFPDGFERSEPAGPTNGYWRDADWLLCRDEKWRPVEPGTFPLADGAPARVGRLRAYGNAINAQQAALFIRASRDIIDGVAV